MILRSVQRPPLTRTLPPLQRNFTSIVRAAPLSAPAVFAGTVDGTRDRVGTLPRTVPQAFGPSIESSTVRHAESCDEAATLGHNVATYVGGALFVGIMGFTVLQRIFG